MTQIASHQTVAPRSGRPARVPVAAPSAPTAPRRPARPSLFVAPAIVVLGRDERSKPHASWFGEADVRAARHAAQLMGMRSLGVAGGDEALAALAARLPSGRLFESGRAFVPFVKGELYDQLVAYLPAEAEVVGPVGDGTAVDELSGERDAPVVIAATPKRKGGRRKAVATDATPDDTSADGPSGDDGDSGDHDGESGDGGDRSADSDGSDDDDASAPDDGHRPTGWPAIRLGSLVLATEGAAEGWFEAIVDQALEGDNFILRWRDWPDEPHFARNRNQLALLPTGRLTWAKRS
ncbi:hypothetical protein [Aureimonas jatrophae]|uniref:hypothetical protein n=1 Tax=Aureimonas jatrophae TaxID=1166073 RepID=UPI001829B564|nr:hypothetical protein [Aureimonas jatrophae]MBB3952805.1 hypothetical protein [Aureimonas jatrophae]